MPTPTLEGYLFPDTYIFPDGTTARAAVDAMVRRFEQVWKPEWTARLDTITMSRNDVMALAVDRREGGALPQERPVIAAVYLNRLRARHAAAGRSDGAIRAGQARRARVLQGPRGRLAVQHVQAQGAAARADRVARAPSIEAALYPANVPYEYFVAFPDGHHEFRARPRRPREGEARGAAGVGLS